MTATNQYQGMLAEIITIGGANGHAVDAYLGWTTRRPLGGVQVEWTSPDDGECGLVSATFETTRGLVTLD